MSAQLIQNFQIEGNRLDPAFDPESARELGVNLAIGVYVRGTILGELLATAGKFAAYAAANVDGTQNPKMILRYACTVTAEGIVLGTGDIYPSQAPVMDAFYKGTFKCEELVGLDANAVTKLAGRVVYGTVAAGIFIF